MPRRLLLNAVMEQGEGILKLAPSWGPRALCIPGRR